jgi:hypothetical protein
LWYGVFLILERIQGKKFASQGSVSAQMALCHAGRGRRWGLFRSPGMEFAGTTLSTMFGFGRSGAYPLDMFVSPLSACVVRVRCTLCHAGAVIL